MMLLSMLERMPAPLAWSAFAAVPYDSGWSKNRMWLPRSDGYAQRLNPAARERRDGLVEALQAAHIGGADAVVRNVLWVGIHVQKANHAGDAINCLDLVADAVEIATGLDDRWFSIASLTWELRPTKPTLTVMIGQQELKDVIACDTCGRLRPPDRFGKEYVHHGTCRNCVRLKAAQRRAKAKGLVEADQPPELDPDDSQPPPW